MKEQQIENRKDFKKESEPEGASEDEVEIVKNIKSKKKSK